MAQFDDGKELGALRTIGEVADALGIKQHVLRYWEQQFPMLQPLKRSGGRRYYRPEDVALVEAIDRLVNREGYTLKGAKKALAHKDMASDIEQAPAPSAQPVEADTSAGEASPSPLPLVDELRYLLGEASGAALAPIARARQARAAADAQTSTAKAGANGGK